MDELLYIQNDVMPALLEGTWISILLIIPSAIFGVCMGVLSATLRVYGHPVFRALGNAYVLLFRGFPLLIQLYIWYFGLPRIGIYLTPYWASVIAFALCSGAYQSEYIRGALLSIRQGQIAAARAIGLTQLQTVVHVVLPQALRRALPGCGNEIIYLIKYSSLAYMVTCIELTGRGKILAAASFKYVEVFLIVGAVYLVLVSVATWILSTLEERFSIPGFERHRG
ncbi:amino acid ABC transporter permease [Desulfonema ishimotonii]|uniref:Amino acid ABC transporter permease n=1 Tax=Desulfonema ishimotonii TaxID=45657 RepID=A0A401FWA5_9BACT|nr:amino acid ABC transporter permease [Desulfonema ishimotonii]GBC61272.1 amino acid ABC transporter permease [Desulfonema ishimotonii]